MEPNEILEPNDLVKVAHHAVIALLGAQIVTYSKFEVNHVIHHAFRNDTTCSHGVTRVQADPDPLLVLHLVYDVPELLEVTADGVALLGHVLQDDGDAGRLGQGRVDLLGDLVHAVAARHLAAGRT